MGLQLQAMAHHEHGRASEREQSDRNSSVAQGLAVDETVILLHPPLPVAGVSIVMERERQQNDSLVDGYPGPPAERDRPEPED